MDTVRDAWVTGDEVVTLGQVCRQLEQVQGSLQAWESSVFGSVRKDLAQLRKELERVRRDSIGTGASPQERRIMARISELLSREECMEKLNNARGSTG
jgi:hypothetical protein